MTEVHCTAHVDYDPKKTVKIGITEKISYIAEVEMTEQEYKDWCNKIDSARGWNREEVAQELMELCHLNRTMDGDVSDAEVDDFFCPGFEKSK